MQEIWKDISNYEGLYQVSNLGNVRSLDHIRINGKSEDRKCLQKGRMLKPAVQSIGYKFVVLSKNGKTKGYRVHRLVVETFIPNPNGYECINHKDENKLNNNVENLEWCTISYNNQYGTKKERQTKSIQKTSGKAIIQYDLEGNVVNRWNCMMDAERHLKKKRSVSPICACCKHKIKSAYGYRWEYEN